MKSNPGFDFEAISSYNLTVFVDDGNLTGATSYIFINISDANDVPDIKNLPTYTNLTENALYGKTVFMVSHNVLSKI